VEKSFYQKTHRGRLTAVFATTRLEQEMSQILVPNWRVFGIG